MTAADDVVFLLDCDNTLLDNDRVQDDLRAHLASEFGLENRDRYWDIFEELRAELGCADYLGALQRYRLGVIERIGDLLNYDISALLGPASAGDKEQETT